MNYSIRNKFEYETTWYETMVCKKRLETLLKSKIFSTVLNKCPLSNKRPPRIFFKKHFYFVSVIALLEYMYNEINCGSSSFYCSHVTSLQKQWPSSQSLNYYVHVSEQFLQRNELFAAFARLFVLTRKDVGATSPFTIFSFFVFK